MDIRVDYAALKRFRDNMAKLTEEQSAQFTESAVKELAARLLAKAKKLTPVGKYKAGSGKVGGTLRRGWTIGKVSRKDGEYTIDVINPTAYAIYVEYGHRTRGGKGWVDGRFMLTVSERELKRDAPGILENKLNRFMEEIIKG